MKTVLITGIAGFIGSHVAEALLRRGDRVVGVDNLNDYYPVEYKKSNLALLGQYQNFSFELCDITDFESLRGVFAREKISHIGHIAARAGVRPSIEDPFIYQEVNVKGSLNVLELARLHGVQNCVITSSSSVYGNSLQIPFREDDSATDRPISPYAATKKASEVLAYTYHHLYGLSVNVVRPFTVYGPRGRPDMAPWLFIEAAIRGTEIRKFGSGDTRRDYTFIGDFADGFVSAIDRVFGYEIFNLGNSATVSLNEFLDTVQRISGKKLNIAVHPKQPGDVDITNADISKARSKLDYDPKTSFAEGMEIFYQWYLQNIEVR